MKSRTEPVSPYSGGTPSKSPGQRGPCLVLVLLSFPSPRSSPITFSLAFFFSPLCSGPMLLIKGICDHPWQWKLSLSNGRQASIFLSLSWKMPTSYSAEGTFLSQAITCCPMRLLTELSHAPALPTLLPSANPWAGRKCPHRHGGHQAAWWPPADAHKSPISNYSEEAWMKRTRKGWKIQMA